MSALARDAVALTGGMVGCAARHCGARRRRRRCVRGGRARPPCKSNAPSSSCCLPRRATAAGPPVRLAPPRRGPNSLARAHARGVRGRPRDGVVA
eukprot:364968-Chlamydomonas_euryale.AAC.20